MPISRKWIATCDQAGCKEVEILTGDQDDGKWTLGEIISDHGWQASPAVKATYCPEHKPTEQERS